jgi:hypothetical protein
VALPKCSILASGKTSVDQATGVPQGDRQNEAKLKAD